MLGGTIGFGIRGFGTGGVNTGSFGIEDFGFGINLWNLRNDAKIRLSRRQWNDSVAHVGGRYRPCPELGHPLVITFDVARLEVRVSRYLKAAGRSL